MLMEEYETAGEEQKKKITTKIDFLNSGAKQAGYMKYNKQIWDGMNYIEGYRPEESIEAGFTLGIFGIKETV